MKLDFFAHKLVTVLEKKIYINLSHNMNYSLLREEIVEMADNFELCPCRHVICSYLLAYLAISAILDKI